MNAILLASSNPGKLAEIKSLLNELPINLFLPLQVDLKLNIEEIGKTYAENAERKARAYCLASGMPTLADDSGLELDILNGEPGIYSARYAPRPNATDADRRAYLLQRLQAHPRPWRACFHCIVAVATPEKELYISEGTCRGEIIDQERGNNGFGYDPIFLLPELGRTMAELTMKQKNRISHRAQAIKAAIPILQNILTR